MTLRIAVLALLVACKGGSSGDDPSDTESPESSTSTLSSTSTADTAATTDTGEAIEWVEQTFIEDGPSEQDIVMVVDNSCSMQDEQDEVVEAIPQVLDVYDEGDVDWHIGVTTTDMDDFGTSALEGRLVRSNGQPGVYSGDANAVAKLGDAVARGINGSGEEKGLLAAYTSYEVLRDSDNAGFFREGAGLHFIILSDENDQSDRANPAVIEGPDDIIDWLDGLSAERTVSFSSIICQETSGGDCIGPSTGTLYRRVSDVFGLEFDVHGDLENAVLTIAQTIVDHAGLRFLVLDEAPTDPATLEVWIDGVLLDPSEWSYDAGAQQVYLNTPAPRGAEVLVRFPA